MPWAFVALMLVYGISCCVFAFVEPPAALRSLFKVPAIFIFLPDRLVMPVGRLFVGVCCFVLVGVLVVKVIGVGL
jgi:hypothetical protein